MKNVITILFIFATLGADAQKIRFTDKRNNWSTTGSAMDCFYFSCYYSYANSDTVIRGTSYCRIRYNRSVNYSVCTTVMPGIGDLCYVREDTIAHKVYYAGDTAEYVLYDYNLVIGDNISYDNGGGVLIDSVIATDSILIYGIYHKTITLQSKYDHGYRMYTVVEGVGATATPFFPVSFGGCFEFNEMLACFAQDAVNPGFSTMQSNCPGGGIIYSNHTSCIALLSIPNAGSGPKLTEIYPNPASNEINITIGEKNKNVMVSAYSIAGQCVYKAEIGEKNNWAINTSLWPAGLYMVIVQNNERIVKKEKVVVIK